MNINANTYPDCKPSTLKKYSTRNSPPYPAQSCPGLILDGKDGKYVSKTDKKGNYKWQKITSTSPVKAKTPSPVKVKTPSPVKEDNVIEKLEGIKLKLGEIKELIITIKTDCPIKANKTRHLMELYNEATKFTCTFLDSLEKVKTPSPVKKSSPVKTKECPADKILNPETNRCIDKKSKKGKALLAQ